MIRSLPLVEAVVPAGAPAVVESPTADKSQPPVDLTAVDRIVAAHGRSREQVIPILQALQRWFRYLPTAALERVCALTDITPAQIVGVATFYRQFRLQPTGRHLVRVCHGTACHVAGARGLHEAFGQALGFSAVAARTAAESAGTGAITDAAGNFTLEKVACLGCCSLAPMVQIGEAIYGNVTVESVGEILREVSAAAVATDDDPQSPAVDRQTTLGVSRTLPPPVADMAVTGEIRIALDSCCMARGADRVHAELLRVVATHRLPAMVRSVGCLGISCHSPLVEIAVAGRAPVIYREVAPEQAERLALRHFAPQGWWRRLRSTALAWIDRLAADATAPVPAASWHGTDRGACAAPAVMQPAAIASVNRRQPVPVSEPPTTPAFLNGQVRLVTEHSGELDPLDLDGYRARGGFAAYAQVLQSGDSAALIAIIEASGQRGRGGAGYPTGRKWRQVQAAAGAVKYVVCNGDEGDPGAFMDRMVLESYPFRVIEGLMLAALAVGAEEGIFYIREEYPLAVKRVAAALERCREAGLLGPAARGPGRRLDCRIVAGAGAFVCGEETALIASLEGRRGMPRLRPPYPSESGYRGCPTLINNVETLAAVPWIVRHGAAAYRRLGTPQAPGTKVFALAGKVLKSGLIEVPMGINLRRIVEELGGGMPPGRRFKAVQIGGPSGGCLGAAHLDTPIDYEALQAAGAIMGSGGMVVLDDRDCMVDLARYFVSFAADEACGRCSIGRIGTRRMLDILERMCAGQGRPGDLDDLETLAAGLQQGSLCGLCRSAPNPVLTSLREFRGEFEAHIQGRCQAGRCRALIRYDIAAGCIGCTLCAQHCPAAAIVAQPYVRHVIDLARCTRCDACRRVCPVDAVEVH